MTISSTTAKVSYNGAGSTGPYTIPYKFAKNADIEATKVSTAGVESTLALTTHYTLTGAGDPSGGTLTLVTALATGEKLVIKRSPAIVQETDYVENAAFPAESHEAALDLLTMICQSLHEQIGRAVLYPVSTSDAEILNTDAFLGAATASKNAAQAAQAAAETARTGAQAAQSIAQSARDGAVAAHDTAVSDAISESVDAAVGASLAAVQPYSASATASANAAAVSAQNAENAAASAADKADRTLSNLTDYRAAAANLGYSRRNLYCNGLSEFDNVNSGASVTPLSGNYVMENGQFWASQAGKFSFQRVVNSLSKLQKSFRYTVLSAYTPVTTDFFIHDIPIEGRDIAYLMWGTANARPITISFTHKVSVAGTYAYALRSYGTAQNTYVFTATLAAGENTVTKTIPGLTAGGVLSSDTKALALRLDLGAGPSQQIAANSWVSGNAGYSCAGCVQAVANAGATYEIGGVKIEEGSFPTGLTSDPQEELRCMRYHPVLIAEAAGGLGCRGKAKSTTLVVIDVPFKVPARVAPTGLTVADATKFSVTDDTTTTACTAITFVSATRYGAKINATVASGLTQDRDYSFVANAAANLRFLGAEI